MPTTTEPLPTSPAPRRADRPRAAGVLRVVIADDHPVYRDGIIRALMESGRYQIVGEARDGEAALRLIERHRPDVALLDLRMPALDALGVLRRLEDGAVNVPVVVISAFTQPQIIERALAAGAAGYLSKDAPREEILVALDAVASGARVVQDSGAARPRAGTAGPGRASAPDLPARRLERGRAARDRGPRRRRGRAPPPRSRHQARREERERHARARGRARASGLRGRRCSSSSSAPAARSGSAARSPSGPALGVTTPLGGSASSDGGT